MKKIKIISLFSVLVVFSFWYGCDSNSEMEESESKIPVKMANVVQKEISFPIHTSGILSTAKEMRLSFKTGGIIKEPLVEEGTSVRKGQLLAELDLREIQAQVNQAKSAFEKAERDYQRIKNLYADSVVTLEQLQNAETGFEMANSNLEIAQFNLNHSKIVAPSDGKILKRFVEINELIGVGIPVFYFGSTTDEWRVKTGISEMDIVHLQLGDSASLFFDAYPGKNFQAIVTEIAESADPLSGTFELEVRFNPQDIKLVSGFVAKVDLFPSKKQKYYVIPIEALVEADDKTGYVFTVADNSVKKIQIGINNVYDREIAVHSGLENITQVVTDGSQYLTEESEIEIVNE